MLPLFLSAASLAAATPLQVDFQLAAAVDSSAPAAAAKRPLLGLPESLDRKLVFDERGKFKVVSFSDMHFGERWGNGSWAAWGPENDENTQRVHGIVLDNEKPDYVVFNGDIMTGENVFKHNATGYLDQCFAPTVQRKIPFSSTHGNHDNANHINHLEEIEYEILHYRARGSYTRADAGQRPWGCGNYWVPVYENKQAHKPSALLWFFDSRSFVSGTGDGPGPVPKSADHYWVDPSAVPPYIEQQAALMKSTWGSVPPSLVFVHIPVEKADELYMLPSKGDHDDEPDPATQGFYNNSYTGLDLPFWRAVRGLERERRGNVMAVTSGHDHGESWCARSSNSSGVVICFDGHSGYGGYVTPHSEVRNGRVFQLDLKKLAKHYPEVETWNSYENNTINDKVLLNEAYMKKYV